MTKNQENLDEMGNVLKNNNLSKVIQEGIEKYEYLYLLKKLKSVTKLVHNSLNSNGFLGRFYQKYTY